ncbi:MAG: alkaline phosphatase [Desulfobacteraceae bacterium]|nr:MAG: alkaline phosphatase [Desulfobacteraceae bacterium]
MKESLCRKLLSGITLCAVFLCSSCISQICNRPVPINNPDIGGGKILLYTTEGDFKGAANVGHLPDMVTFLPDGNGLVSANEGEPADDYSVDPKGSVSIITLNKKVDGLVQDVTTLTFEGVKVPDNVRIKPGSTPDVDLEPEYVAVNEDGSKAWVTLQENNALAIVDLKDKSIMAVKSLGAKDFDTIDIDSKDGAKVSKAPENVFGLYQPDTIVAYRTGGADYVVTANEGDDREYDAWEDYAKAASLKKKKGARFSPQLDRDILGQKGKKKLRILKDMGKDANGVYTQLYLAGTRSFSIWDADGNQVYDSGNDFETYLAANYAKVFNTRVDDVKKQKDIDELKEDNIPYEIIGKKAYFWEGVDARSQKKGCEPEALALTKIGSKTFAYIGLEKQGGLFIYDITNPKSPVFVDYFNDIKYDALPTRSGDLAPEGMVAFVQDKKHYLAVANELSGTIAVYQLANDGRAKKLDSLNVGSFDEGAAEILAYDSKGKQLFVTNGELKTIDIIDVAAPDKLVKSGKIDFSDHADSLQSVSVKNGLVAIAVERK